MKRMNSIVKVSILTAVLLVFGVSTAFAASTGPTDEKRKCDELLKNNDASPDLFSEVLNCDLNVDEETFAAAGGFGFGDADLSRQLITGSDITLTSFTEDPVTPPTTPPGPTCGIGTGKPCPKLP